MYEYIILFVYLIITGQLMESTHADDSEYPDINDLFPAFTEPDPPEALPPHLYKNITLDVEKIDMRKFNDKMIGEMKHKVQEEDGINGSRRSFAIPMYHNWPVHGQGRDYYRRGLTIATSQVGVDMILQMIYMAKSQMTAIEANTYFDTSNTAYRAGFLGFKMKKYFSKLAKIYTYMRKYAYTFTNMKGHIILHHRAVKLHVDFVYYTWVLTNLDGKYRDRLGTRYQSTLVSSEILTGGISVEQKPW